mgnify:CR=1 FL=1
MTKKFFSYSYFETPMWKQEFPEFVKTTNKVCNKYIKQATDKNKEQIEKRNKEYGRTWAFLISPPLFIRSHSYKS